MEYPEGYGERKLKLGSGSQWHNAMDYRSLTFARKRYDSDLVYDGWLRGEVRQSALINGRGVGKGFGAQAGDKLEYDVKASGDKIVFIYMLKNGKASAVQLSGAINQTITFTPSDTLARLEVPLAANGRLTLTTLGGGEILLNGFVVTTDNAFTIVPASINKTPVTEENLSARTLLLKYADVPQYYGISWDKEPFKIRSIRNDELDIFLRNETHNHVAKVLNGNMKGDFANLFIRPLELAPNSEATYTAILSSGSRDAVLAALKKARLPGQYYVIRWKASCRKARNICSASSC
ncbi:hypothetical protein MKQ70_01555 [Chitinophaga sedimenti]|uniref:hypothetical protein n=1 Tax=Chitinophaga sedimenti TaxID=2033606 RepID=UPI002004D797|nr:hypothetical protein [Chitinophaga sedimenti]MCK7553756.1 hypothetical protein [Chitinophaga sedimenti]